jgi:hypothetical protein
MVHLSRRRLLNGLGVAGLATVAGVRVRAARPSFARYTLAQSAEGGTLRVAWYEEYNGRVVDSTDGATTNATTVLDPDDGPAYVEGAPGAVVDLGNVLPGDEGLLVVGLEAVEADLNVWFRPTLTANDENGQPEPEVVAEGVDADGVGELGGAMDVDLWFDNGPFGPCDGSRGALEPAVETAVGDAVGPFTDVVDDFGDGVLLPFSGAANCPDALPGGASRCVGFAWSLADDVGNAVQTDSLAFSLEFVATDCGEDANPFVVGGVTG